MHQVKNPRNKGVVVKIVRMHILDCFLNMNCWKMEEKAAYTRQPPE